MLGFIGPAAAGYQPNPIPSVAWRSDCMGMLLSGAAGTRHSFLLDRQLGRP